MKIHNISKFIVVFSFCLFCLVPFLSPTFAGKGWNWALEQKEDFEQLKNRCFKGFEKTNPEKMTKSEGQGEELAKTTDPSKRTRWGARARKLLEMRDKGFLTPEDYKNLRDKIKVQQNPSSTDEKENRTVNSTSISASDTTEEKNQLKTSFSVSTKSLEDLWKNEVISNKGHWFNIIMGELEKEASKGTLPSVLEKKVERKKSSQAKGFRLMGSALILALYNGKTEDEIAWPYVMQQVRHKFNDKAITELPLDSAKSWIETYNLPGRTTDGFIRLRPYYTILANKLKENIEKKKQEFMSMLTTK